MDYQMLGTIAATVILMVVTAAAFIQAYTSRRSLDYLQQQAWLWKKVNLPQATLQGDLAHLRRETDEIQRDPKDVVEWADALILLITAAAREGHPAGKILDVAWIKLAELKGREWQGPDAEGVVDHVRPFPIQPSTRARLLACINECKAKGQPESAATAAAWFSNLCAPTELMSKPDVYELVKEVYRG